MRRAIYLLFVIAIPLYASDNIFDTAAGHDCFRELLRKAAWGLGGPSERAAFIVEQSDGSIACEEWPPLHAYLSEGFHGKMPEHTIAIAHTHPVRFQYPSQQDDDEATLLGIPVYTITIRGVYKSLPGDRHVVELTNKQSWIRETPKTVIAGGKPSSSATR